MNTSPISRLASAFLLGTALAALAAAQTATVTGTVSNAATRSTLEGAVVSLSGTTESAFTGRDGSFTFTGVAPGSHTLEVSYTGLDRHTQPLVVSAGRNVVPPIGLRSDVYRLDAFTVNGEREGSAAAITRQRNAYNANPAARIYDDDRKDGSLNVRYQLRKQAAIFCDWTNALDQTVVRVQGKDRYRPQKIRYNGMRFNFGFSGNF